MNTVARLATISRTAIAALESLQPLALLAARLVVAQAFFASGLTKLRDWDTTLALFEDEYRVPLLDPVIAAWAGTAGELLLPVLLFAAAPFFAGAWRALRQHRIGMDLPVALGIADEPSSRRTRVRCSWPGWMPRPSSIRRRASSSRPADASSRARAPRQ